MTSVTTKQALGIGAVIILILIALFAITAPDKRNAAERIGDAIGELPDGAGQAADQLGDRTPIQKAGDSIEDAGENAKRNLQD